MSGWTCARCGAPRGGGVQCGSCGGWAPWYDAPPAVPVRPLVAGLGAFGQAVAVALATVLVAGLVALDVRQRQIARRIRLEFTAAIAELSAYVARERGRPFLRPVDARLLGDHEFLDALYGVPGEAGEEEPALPADFGATMYALRMADAYDDVGGSAAQALDEGVVGFYDDVTEKLYVRGQTVTPYVRLTLVHELTHAWQDQHHDLGALTQDVTDPDALLAADALVEGDATRVEEAWRAAQSPADRAAIERVERGLALDREPSRAERSLGLLYDFPYSVGLDFVSALYDRDGNAAVDAAFDRPPASTEQVLHPERYDRRERPRDVAQPQPTTDPVDVGVLGELGLVLLAGRGDLDERALSAAAGWGGDRYATWDDGELLCSALTVVMDTRAAQDRLFAALRRYTETGWVVTDRGRAGIHVRSCVPSRE